MDNIALAFSGGGFRAAAFSLGCLSYLNRVQYKGRPLLQNVKYISSTSGGSITNLVYTSMLYKHRGKQEGFFQTFYRFLYTELEGEKLIASAMAVLKDGSKWTGRPAKGRNLINAFSIAYDEMLQAETFDVYWRKEEIKTEPVIWPHIEEICVNATEFTNGQAFRFQSQRDDIPRGKVGNGDIFFTDTAVAGKLKLADLLASSSCFPSGFEPMIFPGDYAHPGLSTDTLEKSISYKANVFTLPGAETDENDGDKSIEAEEDPYNTYDLLADKEFRKGINIAIMDGGVTDNQAIDACQLANERRKEKPFDLFLACDVSSFLMDGYTIPMEKRKWYSHITINGLILIYALLLTVLPVLLFVIKPWQNWMYIPATVSGLAWLPVLLKTCKSFFRRKKEPSSWAEIFNKYKHIFKKLRLSALEQMLLSRAKSVFILANDIYLKQIRRMYYAALYGNNNYRNKTIQNAIYDLSKVKFPENKPPQTLQPSAAMIEVAEKARMMGTTLWFDKKHRKEKIKEKIIATGQFTTCYNLLKFLNKKDDAALNEDLRKLKKTLEDDWKLFCEDPLFME